MSADVTIVVDDFRKGSRFFSICYYFRLSVDITKLGLRIGYRESVVNGLPQRKKPLNLAVMQPEDRIERRDRDTRHMPGSPRNCPSCTVVHRPVNTFKRIHRACRVGGLCRFVGETVPVAGLREDCPSSCLKVRTLKIFIG